MRDLPGEIARHSTGGADNFTVARNLPPPRRCRTSSRLHTAPAGHAVDLDAVDHHGVPFARADLRCRRKPPRGPLLEQLPDTLTRAGLVGRVADLLVPPEDHQRRPSIAALDVFHFDADLRILPHPFDFSAQARESIETVAITVVGEADGHDVGLAESGAGQPPEFDPAEEFGTLMVSELVDQHGAREV